MHDHSAKRTVTPGVALALLAMACKSEAIGDPCVPEDEYNSTFSGFSLGEINVESPSDP